MFPVDQLSAFIGGLLTFLAPCTLPLVPAYLAFIGGAPGGEDPRHRRKNIFLNALLFVIGFSMIFVLFGIIGGALGASLLLHRALISQVGGFIVIIFGLSMLGLFHLPFAGSLPTKLPLLAKDGGLLRAFLLGVLFALGWSPCLGPVLGTILILATSHASAMYGGWLLFVYALGLAIPFLFLAALYGHAVTYVGKLQSALPIITKVGAVLIVLLGLLLLFGQFGAINAYGVDIFSTFGLDRLLDRM